MARAHPNMACAHPVIALRPTPPNIACAHPNTTWYRAAPHHPPLIWHLAGLTLECEPMEGAAGCSIQATCVECNAISTASEMRVALRGRFARAHSVEWQVGTRRILGGRARAVLGGENAPY
eukprot:3936594-Prymnesium_polylepis.1